ncbi:MAG TPA: hypothetical protein VF610_03820 [Segetibacter sp.]
MTKVYTFSVLFCLLALAADAQFSKGEKVLGGNLGFSTDTSENYYNSVSGYKHTYVSFAPSLGWFTKPQQLVGVGLIYGYNQQKLTNNNAGDPTKSYAHNAGVTIFSQRFITLGPKLYFTMQAGLSVAYSFGKSFYKTGSTDVATNNNGYGVNANLAPGLSYRLLNRVLFEGYLSNLINIGYNYTKSEPGNSSTSNNKSYQESFGISSSLSNSSLGNVGIGFRWLLKK